MSQMVLIIHFPSLGLAFLEFNTILIVISRFTRDEKN